MFQYNLRTLMLVMLGVCIFTWLFFVLPGEIGLIVLLCGLFLAPSAVVAGILYFRGYPQAFTIGCVPPLLLLGLFLLFEGDDIFRFRRRDQLESKIVILICMLLLLAGGGIAAGIRWLAVWSQQPAVQTKTFPGLSRDLASAPRPAAHGSAGASPSHATPARTLNPEP